MENSKDKDESIERHGDEGRKKSKFRVVAGESSTRRCDLAGLTFTFCFHRRDISSAESVSWKGEAFS